MRLRLAPGVVSPEFFVSYVRGSRAVADYLRKVNHGVTRDGINTAELLELPVVVPSFAEQIEIVSEVEQRLSIIRQVEDEVNADFRRVARLRQSILKRAFEGRLVEQDAGDEAADALLERVRASENASKDRKGLKKQNRRRGR